MDLFFILKLLVVIFFLVMFLRNSRIVWGIGLLTVSTAFLLDTIWTTFGREEILADIGFFFYVLSGGLFAGAAIWLWSVLRPHVATPMPASASSPQTSTAQTPVAQALEAPQLIDYGRPQSGEYGAINPRELFEEIKARFSPQDVDDLIFDLQLNEIEINTPQQPFVHTVTRLVNRAQLEDKMGALALAVERILTPVPPESLPRPEKLSASSPPTVLRHYLLAHYSLNDLKRLASRLDVDYEHFDHANKSQLARNLLSYLQRRNQLDQLITQLQLDAMNDKEEVSAT